MFLHANILHLAGNMFYLYVVGDDVEITLGRAKYLLIYLLSGVTGALVHSIVTPCTSRGGGGSIHCWSFCGDKRAHRRIPGPLPGLPHVLLPGLQAHLLLHNG